MKLRPYQEDAVTSLINWFDSESIDRRPLLNLPTALRLILIESALEQHNPIEI